MTTQQINKSLLSILFFFLIPAAPLLAQADKIDFQKIKEKHKDDDIVYLKYFRELTIGIDGEDLVIRDAHQSEMLFLNEKSSVYAQQSISYVNHVSEIEDIDAYTMVPKDKGGYKKVPVRDYKDASNTSSDVFFDDVNEKSFVFPQPVTGAIGVINYTELFKDPHFLNKFYFATGWPIEESRLRIKFNKNVNLKYIMENNSEDIVFEESEEGNNKVYTWKRKNVDKLKYEADAKSVAYETPHVIIYIASYEGKEKVHKVLENTRGLYKYCYSLLKKGLEEPDAEVKHICDSLISGVTDDHEKIRRIYSYVQENIKYIAFEDGLGGFIPRKPSLVCNRKYGDCKDIASLICAMLNYSGVKAYHTWVGTSSIPYKFSEVPVMGVANHMIASVYMDNRWYFLDGTAKFLSYRYPSGFIQGKQAMIGISKDSFVLADIPVIPASVNMTSINLNIAVAGDTVKGSGMRKVDGLTRCNLGEMVYYVEGSKLQERWESYLELGQNNCKVDNIKITGLKDRDSLMEFTFDFNIPKYVTHLENEIYVNLNLVRLWEGTDVDLDKRTRDYMFDETRGNEMNFVFTIPKGYTVTRIPAPMKIDKGDFGFDFSYEKKGNTIIYHQKYWYNSLFLNKPEFAAWNETVEMVHKAYRQTLVLTASTTKK
jgi:transglutaminase-like putative cysteine protease